VEVISVLLLPDLTTQYQQPMNPIFVSLFKYN